MGGYVSFSGILTFPKSGELRAIAADLPADRLLVETDAPYLAPVPFRGKRNEPAHVAHTARVLADVRGVSGTTEIAALTTANFRRLFRKALEVQVRRSFLKKRTKKLLDFIWASRCSSTRTPIRKSLLLLFFRKEDLPSDAHNAPRLRRQHRRARRLAADGAGDWGACDPTEARNRRLRAAIVIEGPRGRVLVDTGPRSARPDFGQRRATHRCADFHARACRSHHGVGRRAAAQPHYRRAAAGFWDGADHGRNRPAFRLCVQALDAGGVLPAGAGHHDDHGRRYDPGRRARDRDVRAGPPRHAHARGCARKNLGIAPMWCGLMMQHSQRSPVSIFGLSAASSARRI